MSDRFSVKVATSDEDIQACHMVRIEVFVDEQGFPADTEFDEVDANGTCVSFLVSDGQQGVGTIRLVPSKGKLTRLAVLKSHRSYGLGRDLVNALEDYVKSHPGEFAVREEEGRRLVKIKIHSQIPVVKFYAKMGYTTKGDEFDEEGEPHLLMEKDIEV